MLSTTLTTDAAETARIAEALGAKLGLSDAQGNRRDATPAEIKQYVINVLAQDVHDYFRRKAQDAAVKPAPLTVT